MWTRKDLKTKAKILVKQHYWWMVLVSFLMLFVGGSGTGSGGSSSARNSAKNNSYNNGNDLDFTLLLTMIAAMIVVILVVVVIAMVIRIFALNPIYVGCLRYILNTREGNRNFNDVLFAFSGSYMNIVKIMFFRDLKVFLWTLLLIIPGIVKSYEYQMIPYILSENPDIDSQRAFELTKSMTYGDKWNMFVLGLSFLPWELLSAFTCLIVGIFWVNPYVNVTMAELYIELREKAFRNNAVQPGELYGYTYNGMYMKY